MSLHRRGTRARGRRRADLRYRQPGGKATLELAFARDRVLDPRINFTGGANRTYFDSAGVLQSGANNVARFDHDMATGTPRGISVWEGRENGI